MLRIPSSDQAQTICEFLREASYDAPTLSSELGLESGLHANLDNMAELLRKTKGESARPVLARLFFVGMPSALDVCRTVIPANALEAFTATGLLKIFGDEAIPEAVVVPHGKFYIAADTSQNRPGNAEMVMGASGSTRLLAGFLTHRKGASCLDVGCGSGVLSLEAAEFADHVIGVDINKRAVEFVKFNAALNSVSNATFFAGDTFAPVEGKTFDHIICNPPFLVGPSQVSAYCDSPLELDGFSRLIAVTAPGFLNDGGYFQMLCEWVHIEGEQWEKKLQEWTANSGCDTIVVTGTKVRPVDYAQRRHEEAKQMRGHEDEETLLERLDYFERHKVKLIQGGVITMRKRKAKNWFSIIDTDATLGRAGAGLRERFESLTYLSEHSSEQLMEGKYRLSESAELEQRSRLGAEGNEVVGIRLLQNDGIRDSLALDEVVAKFIWLFDGSQSLGEIADSVSESLGWPAEDARKKCLALAKRLLQSSFVKPV